jgi:hypothetical protein
MKVKYSKQIFLSLFGLLTFIFCWQTTCASSIYGVVYDNKRNALVDVDIELESNVGSFRNHTRTDST